MSSSARAHDNIRYPSLMDRNRITALLAGHLGQCKGIAAGWLFGSVARGTARSSRSPRGSSDVDVAVLFDSALSRHALLDLQAELSSLLEREVQVVDARGAPVDLLHRVFRDGILVVDRERGKRIVFEVDARNRYFDMRPILLEYRRPRIGSP